MTADRFRRVSLLAALFCTALTGRAATGGLESGFTPGIDGPVLASAVQPDGKLVIGGSFTTAAGVSRNNLARLNADGSADLAFNPNVVGEVGGVLVQSDGKLVIFGQFSSVGGVSRSNLARLNADGSLDSSFIPSVNGPVLCAVLESDGQIVLGGQFSSVAGAGRNNLARINADGTIDFTFNPGANGPVISVVAQTDGKLVVGGSFGFLASLPRSNLARLNSDGSADTAFNPGVSGTVLSLLVQADGRVVLGGQFSAVGGASRNRLARLHADGSIDAGFNPDVDGDVATLVGQADGRILFGGAFTTVGGTARNRLARLNADGLVDNAFNPDAGGPVHALALQADGRVLVGGAFVTMGGEACSTLVRLENDAATQTLSQSAASRIEWLRGGAAPEASGVVFELSSNGSSWSLLGLGTRISGGWELTGLNLVGDQQIRARAKIAGGRYGASAGLTEAVISFSLPAPEIAIRGSDIAIADGDLVPGFADGTDFGGALVGGNTVVRAFSIENSGTVALHLTGSPRVLIGGAHAADFTVVPPPATVHGEAVPFLVTFAPGATGLRTATLTIANDDVDEGTFDFALQGTGLALGGVDTGLDGNFNGRVTSALIQLDGKLVIGGGFTTAGGASRIRIARFNTDGSVDTGFTASVGSSNVAINNSIRTMALQRDGSILIGGHFTTANGAGRSRLAKLNPDGTNDPLFNPSPNGVVFCLLVQPDGKILVAGQFTTIGGVARQRLARLNADGSVDPTFDPGVDSDVFSLALQADGKIVIGGPFLTVGGVARNRLARLNSDGSLDADFNPNADNSVTAIALQSDGKIIAGGSFANVGGVGRSRLARLNADGSVDAGFNPGANGNVNSIVLQADGAIIASGEFTTLGGSARNRVGRLNADGTLDGSFNPSANGAVYCALLAPDGSVVLGGDFTTMGGVARNRLARVVNQAPLQSLAVTSPSRIEWLLGGAAPLVQQPVFEMSLDAGGSWIPLGAATSVSGGWELTGLSLPSGGLLRARARTLGGEGGNSSGLLETVAGFPTGSRLVLEQPLNSPVPPGGSRDFGHLAVGAATTRTFIVRNAGPAELSALALTIDGRDAAMFEVIESPASTIAPGAFTTFTLRFTPASDGAKIASLQLTSNDPAHSPFALTLTGTGPGPEMVVSGNGTAIADGDSTPAVVDHTEFGSTLVAGGVVVRTFTISNTDVIALNLTGTPRVQISGAQASDFSVTLQPAASVASGGGVTTFQIAFDPSAVGLRMATVSIASDDADENPYNFTIQGTGALPGEVDTGFNPGPDRFSASLSTQPDGMILIGGGFSLIGNVSRPHIARISADGLLDASFNPNADADVLSIALKLDGKIMIGGGFTNVGGLSRTRLTRLSADGSVDTGFNPTLTANNSVYSIALLPDGNFLLAGGFNTLGGIARNGLGRVSGNGIIDAFNPGPSFSYVGGLALHDDLRIAIGGSFVSVGGQTRNCFALLNASGGVLGSFDPNVQSVVECVAIQADGKMVIGGSFTAVGGQPRNRIARLNADGSVDASFDPNLNSSVNSIVLQADGKILVGGNFTTVGGVAKAYFARLHADGTLDAGFGTSPGNPVTSVGLQADGKILLSGDFKIVGGLSRSGIARLTNDLATQSLAVTEADRVEWLRGGSSPETHEVLFELSTNGGASWAALGAGSRIAGGWDLTGLSLPTSGQVRARARIVNGQRAGSSGIVESITAYTLPTPELTVFEGNGTSGTERQSGGATITFAPTVLGASSAAQTFTIHNAGSATLSGLALSKTGTHPGDFALGALGATSLAPGATTTFTVTFQPAAAGPRAATVEIASNDADESPFTLAVTGTGLTAHDAWRNTHFGTTANTGNAANLADPDGDGRVNLLEFALALDPLTPDGDEFPATSVTESEWVFTYRRPAAAGGVTISVEASTDLAAWGTGLLTRHEMTATADVVETWQAACLRSTNPKVFFRLRVTAP